jgi:HupE / UreJ protein
MARAGSGLGVPPRQVLALAAGALVFGVSEVTSAHHLEVSRLELRPQAGEEIKGRIFIDPRLPLSSEPEAELRALVIRNLHFAVAGRGCELNVKVLEVWREDSASAGHLADVVCELNRPEGLPLTVSLGRELGKLVIVYPEANAPGETVEREVVAPEGGDSELRLGRTQANRVRKSGALEWVRLGFEHVLPDGLDHVLFVVSLVLGTFRELRVLLLSVLAFTLGHALALYLAAMGFLKAPPELIEPLIALSIAALSGLVFWQLVRAGVLNKPGPAGGVHGEAEALAMRASPAHRWPLAAWFGVVHGLGFAGAFSALGAGTGTLALTLLQFHLGVELGHLIVLLLAWLWFRKVVPRLAEIGQVRERMVLLGFAVALCSTGLALFAERVQQTLGGN